MHNRHASVDLEAYCARIGYTGDLGPTLETLRELQAHHVAAIPFENLDVLLGREIGLAPQAIDTKLIVERRGGYCFEQSGLFKRVLEAIGFEVVGLLARVQWMSMPESPPSPRTHMALRVIVDGRPWLADVGFGGNVPAAPLAMDTDLPQPTPHGTYRLVPIGQELQLQLRLEQAWVALYQLSPQPQLAVDYELPNWYTATHPSSHFRHQLSVALTTTEARYMLKNARLTVRLTNGEETQRWLGLDELGATLGKTFGLPVSADWSAVLERAVAARQSADP
ncbi:arylamine N-acetyltransferase [Halomonas sp. HP20-15]|uniref:arylamine N-acetyltransferase family protein n=1 Tax=Halomonas sp. HP20-15 TaxID=3085901 RepID=UPI002981E1CF|nr:arylamine N-acetyltransferase [Halomonas sp. HP20-15]MDW5377203.1 arylamine N-acetyltransferase [Halomonas sp. HP20-15]